MKSMFRYLPSVNRVLSDERVRQLEKTHPHSLLLDLVRQHLERDRLTIAAGNPCPSIDEIVESVCTETDALGSSSLRPIINASGILLNTNLGRAPLSKEAIASMNAVAKGYSNLEFDLASGKRGSRNIHTERLLCHLTGAEAALVVNNSASAVLLTLTTLAKRKEIIVSRGQAVEIGGGFRIPDVMRQSGAKLVEVGTTNCTYVTDYEQAINSRTVALMRVHSSNFRLMGFTHSVTLDELVALANRYDLPVLDDLGSGCLLDTTRFGLYAEPTLQQSVAAGAGLVLSSGDKLMGGPQAGIIVGKQQFIDKLKKHPLARAVRIDKVTLAGLVVTLIHYLKGEAVAKIPVWRMISTPVEEIEQRAGLWTKTLGDLAQVIPGETMIGGGSLPGGTLPTRLVAVGGGGKKGRSMAQMMSKRLRHREIPVIGRISEDILLLDPRCVLPEEDPIVLQALQDLAVDIKRGNPIP